MYELAARPHYRDFVTQLRDNFFARQKAEPPVYLHSAQFASEQGELSLYKDARFASKDCLKRISQAIAENYSDNRLAEGFERAIVKDFGMERVKYVLASNFRKPSEESRKRFASVEERLRKNVPDEMKARPNWVAVRTRENEKKGRVEKFLIDVHTGKFAKSDDSTTWTTFDDALKYARENGGVTIAYALDGKDNIACIDLDGCFTENGDMSPLASEMFCKGNGTYAEKSVSGYGLHIFGKTNGMDLRAFSKDGDLEFYQRAHFITVTGDNYGSGELKSLDTPEMKAVLERKCARRSTWGGTSKGIEGLSVMSDREVVERASAAKNGDVFASLYRGEDLQNNHSNSDMSLMNRLAFWCNGDKEQMLRIFATSGLYRPDKSPDYYEGTAIKAIRDTETRYQSKEEKPAQKPNGNKGGNGSGGKR